MMSKTPQVEKHFSANTIFTPEISFRCLAISRLAMSFASSIMKYGVLNSSFSMFVPISCNVSIHACDGKYLDNKNGKTAITFRL
ncbi:Uncharacterised protein [Vibrio cholerae]|nr:Uncharacterised protein [Vibrio cholerae]CSI55204.1 Uncharacterised protein [Vibrio cholerae]